MKTILILLAAALMALSSFGCSSGARVDTPILDVGASGSIKTP